MLALAALLAAPAALAQDAPDAAAAKDTAFKVGSAVDPSLEMKGIDGKTYTMKEFRGKVVFIHFWSIVCPYEQVAEPKMKKLQEEFGAKGVVQIAINANQGELDASGDTPYAKLVDHAKKAELNFPVVVDPGNKISDRFEARTTPHCFVIDKEGVLRYAGALDDDPRGGKAEGATFYVRDAIVALLDGKAPEVTETKPYG